MLDSVGIRLPKYKVRELGLSLETSGDITAGIIDKLLFVQVGRVEPWYPGMQSPCSLWCDGFIRGVNETLRLLRIL